MGDFWNRLDDIMKRLPDDEEDLGTQQRADASNAPNGSSLASTNTGQKPAYDPDTGISCPVLVPRVTSHFGDTKGRSAPHDGVDLHNPVGSPVFAAEDGTVNSVGPSSHGGNQIIIHNDSGGVSGYAHTGAVDELRPGDRVQSGQRIGVSDQSGTDQAHLHYTYRPSPGAPRVDPIENHIGDVCDID